MSTPEERARLDAAYRATTYRVGTLALRMDEPNPPALDVLMEGRGYREYAYITAYNPGSRPLPESENRRRQRALIERLQDEGRLVLRGEAISDTADWPPEPSLLVLGMSAEEAKALGRELGQNAVVVGRLGDAPHLAWLV